MTNSYNILTIYLGKKAEYNTNTSGDLEYNAISQQLKDEEEERKLLRANLRLVMEKDPNKIGEAQQMATKLNLPEVLH